MARTEEALATADVVLLIVDRIAPAPTHSDATKFPLSMAFKIGVIQCLAMVPGTSRSGATILSGSSEERVVRVAQRLLTALRDPLAKLNNRLQHLYNAWLLALLARLVWAFGRGWERSAFEQRVLRHVLACVTAQLATHIASACSVLLLIHRGDAGADSEQRERVERACPATLVDEALRLRLEERDSTCIVSSRPAFSVYAV